MVREQEVKLDVELPSLIQLLVALVVVHVADVHFRSPPRVINNALDGAVVQKHNTKCAQLSSRSFEREFVQVELEVLPVTDSFYNSSQKSIPSNKLNSKHRMHYLQNK